MINYVSNAVQIILDRNRRHPIILIIFRIFLIKNADKRDMCFEYHMSYRILYTWDLARFPLATVRKIVYILYRIIYYIFYINISTTKYEGCEWTGQTIRLCRKIHSLMVFFPEINFKLTVPCEGKKTRNVLNINIYRKRKNKNFTFS